MNEPTTAVAAVWTLVGTVVSLLVTAAATLGPLVIQRLRTKLELDNDELRRRASDKAVAAVEDLSRGQQLHGVDKVMMAARIADEQTPKHVAIKSEDVRAAVTRMRASLPTGGVLPPLSIPVQLVSSEPPAGGSDDRVTNPLPPTRLPKEWAVAATQAAGLQPPRKP